MFRCRQEHITFLQDGMATSLISPPLQIPDIRISGREASQSQLYDHHHALMHLKKADMILIKSRQVKEYKFSWQGHKEM